MTTKASARKVEAISKALEESEAANAKQRVELENARATIEGLGQDLDKLAGQVGNLTRERHEMLARLDRAAVWEDYCRRIFEAFHVPTTPNVIDGQVGFRRMMQLGDHKRQLRVDRLAKHARDYAVKMMGDDKQTSQIVGASKAYAERMESLREHWQTEAGDAYLRFDVNDNPILFCQCGEKTEFVVSWDVKVICSAGCGAAYEFQHLAIDVKDPSKGARTVLRRVPVPKPDSPHMHVEKVEKMIGSLVVEVPKPAEHIVLSPTMTDLMVSPEAIEKVELPTLPKMDEHFVSSETKECGHCGGPLTVPDGKPNHLGCVKCGWDAPLIDPQNSPAYDLPGASPDLPTFELPESVKQKLEELRKTPWGQALDTMECPECKAPLRPKGDGVLGCTKCATMIFRDPPQLEREERDIDIDDGC